MRRGEIAAVLLVLSCGGSGAEAPQTDFPGTCTVSLTGAVTAQFDCMLAFMFWGIDQGGAFILMRARNGAGYAATALIGFV